jgi:hypothetical protein
MIVRNRSLLEQPMHCWRSADTFSKRAVAQLDEHLKAGPPGRRRRRWMAIASRHAASAALEILVGNQY